MSRCFSYPPPGYLKEGARGDSANQSIKVCFVRWADLVNFALVVLSLMIDLGKKTKEVTLTLTCKQVALSLVIVSA